MRLHLTKKRLVILTAVGIRFSLAPVTGHAYDMGVFAFEQRIFFKNGIFGLKTFPTLPPIYFVQLLFYAPYAVLESLGLHDYQLLYHTSFMIEAVFLKTPYILADIAIFVVIQRITGRLLPATLFFFNPLTIYESSVWGIYDPLMLLAVVLGLLLLKRNSVLMSSLAFSVEALRSEEHTSELQSRPHLVCRLLLEKKKYTYTAYPGVPVSSRTARH